METLTNINLTPLEKILSDKLGVNIILAKEVINKNEKERIQIVSNELIDHSGVLQHSMNSVKITSFSGGEIYPPLEDGDEHFVWFSLNYSFKFKNFGSNGVLLADVWYFLESKTWKVQFIGEK